MADPLKDMGLHWYKEIMIKHVITFLIISFLGSAAFGNDLPILQRTPVDALFIAHMDLPKSLVENIHALSEEIKHTWPDAHYYRETIDFGKVFHALEKGRLVERPIPAFIAGIRNQVFELFKDQLDPKDCALDYDNCIVTMYQPGDGIAPHIDRNLTWAQMKEERTYYFDESIIGLIVEPDTVQNLFFENPKIGESSRFYLEEKPGTAFLFKGTLRHEWKHGLLPVKKGRISMTFRKVLKKEKAAVH